MDATEVPHGVQVAAYRIVQEALTNVVKHAGADSAAVSVTDRGDGLDLVSGNGPNRGGRHPASATDPSGPTKSRP